MGLRDARDAAEERADSIDATAADAGRADAAFAEAPDELRDAVRVRRFNAALPALVAARAAAGKHVVLVDMYGAFTKDPSFKTKLLANGLHPTDAGYAAMAQVWWTAIGGLLR